MMMTTGDDFGADRSGRGVSEKGGSGGAEGGGLRLGEELEQAAEGLYHRSESFNPFKFFTLPAEGEGDLTPEGFVMRLGLSQQLIDELELPLDRVVEEREFDGFFPTADDLAEGEGTDTDDPEVVAEAERYRRLEEVLRKRLRGLKVLRVGQVDIRCYIAGLDERGNIAGLVTTAVET